VKEFKIIFRQEAMTQRKQGHAKGRECRARSVQESSGEWGENNSEGTTPVDKASRTSLKMQERKTVGERGASYENRKKTQKGLKRGLFLRDPELTTNKNNTTPHRLPFSDNER